MSVKFVENVRSLLRIFSLQESLGDRVFAHVLASTLLRHFNPCVCRGIEVPSCVLSRPDPSRRVGHCTLAFGSESTNADDVVQPTAPSAVFTSNPSSTAASAAVTVPNSNALSSSPCLKKSCEFESLSVPAAVCPGYQSQVDENVATVDFPPADLPADTLEFRIVVTHVDSDGHIYGHALTEGV